MEDSWAVWHYLHKWYVRAGKTPVPPAMPHGDPRSCSNLSQGSGPVRQRIIQPHLTPLPAPTPPHSIHTTEYRFPLTSIFLSLAINRKGIKKHLKKKKGNPVTNNITSLTKNECQAICQAMGTPHTVNNYRTYCTFCSDITAPSSSWMLVLGLPSSEVLQLIFFTLTGTDVLLPSVVGLLVSSKDFWYAIDDNVCSSVPAEIWGFVFRASLSLCFPTSFKDSWM